MNGYLMQEQSFIMGQDKFVESYSPKNKFGVVFEDDGETAYFYAVEKDDQGQGLQVLDALHIYEAPLSGEISPQSSKLAMLWSRNWMQCVLIIDARCHALYDFEGRGGYNINEFPPPNSIWTTGERKLTDELLKRFF
jgi:hypothetical protein